MGHLESRVDTPAGEKCGGQGGADGEHAWSAVLQALMQNIGSVCEEVGAGIIEMPQGLLAELLQLPLGGFPGEVGVRLGEA